MRLIILLIVIPNAMFLWIPRISCPFPPSSCVTRQTSSSAHGGPCSPLFEGLKLYGSRKTYHTNVNNNKFDIREVISECRRKGDFSNAIKVATEMEEDPLGLSSAMATSVIRLYGEAKELGRALAVLGKLKANNQKVNGSRRAALDERGFRVAARERRAKGRHAFTPANTLFR